MKAESVVLEPGNGEFYWCNFGIFFDMLVGAYSVLGEMELDRLIRCIKHPNGVFGTIGVFLVKDP